MKKTTLVVLTLLAFNLTKAQQQNIVFKGLVDTKHNGTKVQMYNNLTKENGETVVKDGKWELTVPFSVATRYMFSSEAESKKKGGYAPFGILVDGPADITVSGDLEAFATAKVTGSAPQDVLQEFYKQSSERQAQILTQIKDRYKVTKQDIYDEKPGTQAASRELDSLSTLADAEVVVNLTRQHTNSLAAPFILDRFGAAVSPDLALQLYQGMSAQVKETIFGKNAFSQIQGALQAQLGNSIQDFVLKTPDEQLFKASSLKGSYVLIDFWASWCGPCIEEFKNLRELYKTYHGTQPFQILGISTDKSAAAWHAALKKEQLPWMQVIDEVGDRSIASSQFAVKSLPTTYLIDPNGKIIAKNLRGKALEEKLKEIFQ